MTVARLINRERVVVLGWGRAILLQLAHPLVAAGVAAHSDFAGHRLGRLRRLHGTIGAMLDFASGDPRRARATAARINAIHDRVSGRLRDHARGYPERAGYSATDPALLRWVHATLLDSIPVAYERFVGPLGEGWRERYCEESAEVARLLRIPDALAIGWAGELDAYLEEMLRGPSIEVTPAAREVARQLLYPPVTDPTRPAAWLVRLVTLGLLPRSIRDEYGFPWSPARERALAAFAFLVRRTLPLTPGFLRYWRLDAGTR
jgi:uncharacterized protein (DUF2236 family)